MIQAPKRHCGGSWLKYVHPSVYVLHNSEGSEDTCTQVSVKGLLAMINLLKDYCSAS